MPELPEVETMRRGVAPVQGARIVDASRLPCRLKAICISPRIDVLRRRVQGRRIEEVARLGKRVVLRLDSQDVLIFEPRMTGLVLLDEAPNQTHLRFRLDLDSTATPHIFYWDRRGLGSVRLLTPQALETQLGPHKLGPDALTIRWEELRDRLHASRRAIKVALLDQRVVAGVGNLYASEILHLAGIHPETRCDRLSKSQWRDIHRRQLEVLKQAISMEGSTLSDGTYRNALNDPGGFQNHHRVYDREGEPCPRCGAAIRRTVQAQRATFFCPGCQKKAARRS